MCGNMTRGRKGRQKRQKPIQQLNPDVGGVSSLCPGFLGAPELVPLAAVVAMCQYAYRTGSRVPRSTPAFALPLVL